MGGYQSLLDVYDGKYMITSRAELRKRGRKKVISDFIISELKKKIKKGNCKHKLFKTDSNRRNLLMKAIIDRNEPLALEILKITDPKKIGLFQNDRFNYCPLTLALTSKSIPILFEIISKYKKNNQSMMIQNNVRKETPLMIAVNELLLEPVAIEMLKSKCRIGLEQVDIYKNTALNLACQIGQKNFVLEVLKHSPVLCRINSKNIYGCTALDYAKKQKNFQEIVTIMENIMKSIQRFEPNQMQIQYRIDKKSCLFCAYDTDQSVMYYRCKHVLLCCEECKKNIPNKICPFCRVNSSKIEKVYICS